MLDEELSPRERRHQRTQQAILDAARALLAEGGVEKLSIRAIADRIDYSPAGLYEYYGSKEEIIGAVCRQGHRTLKQYMAKVPLTLPPDEYIVEIGLAYIEFAMQNPDYFLLIFTSVAGQLSHDEASELPSPEMLNDNSSFPILLRGIQRAVDAGTICFLPGKGLIQTAYALWSIVHGASMLRVGYLSTLRVDFDETDRLMLTAFVHGLRPPP
jgi:AcrR family transcriptional regulator